MKTFLFYIAAAPKTTYWGYEGKMHVPGKQVSVQASDLHSAFKIALNRAFDSFGINTEKVEFIRAIINGETVESTEYMEYLMKSRKA